MNQEVMNFFSPAGAGSGLRPDPDFDREPGEDPVLVVRRDQEAGNDQLPYLQAGARRPVLRAHLRPDQGLRVLVRQVQAHEVQGHHLRKVLGRSHALARAARAHGPYRAGRAGRAHLVPEVAADPHRPAARHDAEGSRADSLFRILHRARAGPHPAARTVSCCPRTSISRRRTNTAQDSFTAQIGAEAIREMLKALDLEKMAADLRVEIAEIDLRTQAEEARQAPQADRGLHPVRQQAGMDDPDVKCR